MGKTFLEVGKKNLFISINTTSPRLFGNSVPGHTTREGATSMQTHPDGRVGFELATDAAVRWHPVLCLCELGQDIPYMYLIHCLIRYLSYLIHYVTHYLSDYVLDFSVLIIQFQDIYLNII